MNFKVSALAELGQVKNVAAIKEFSRTLLDENLKY